MTAYTAAFMASVTCELTAQDRDRDLQAWGMNAYCKSGMLVKRGVRLVAYTD